MPQQNIKNLKDTINHNILPLVDNLLQDSIGAREAQFFKKIQSDLIGAQSEQNLLEIFLELSTLMFSDFFFTDEQLEKIDALLENCEQIASTFSANTGVPN
tara:strand:- start:2841 stop:3143 length:303 start_codon:yes stop_codon:yes gene_type:complete